MPGTSKRKDGCYQVRYRNMGRPEVTKAMSHTEASRAARFLRFQGAMRVRICRAS